MRVSVRDADGNTGAMAGRGVDVDAAAHQTDSLVDTRQAESTAPARGGLVESSSVVGNMQLERVLGRLQRHERPMRSGMSGRVAERLLRNTIDTKRDVVGDADLTRLRGEHGAHRITATILGAELTDRRYQASMPQGGRVQL